MSNIVENKTINTPKGINVIGKGIIISVVFTIVLLLIFSCILTYSSIPDSTIAPVIIIVTAVSILAGSSISTRKIDKNGIINGGIIGLVYILAIYLLSSAVTGDYSLNTTSIILVIAGLMAGALGGVIGVNLK